jgi:hypothetical protein
MKDTYTAITGPASKFVTAVVLLITLATTGCTSKSSATPENFTIGLNKYFGEHPDCLLANVRFPFETSDRKQTAQMDSLVKAHLLDRTQEASIHVSRYLPSDTGARFAPRFCYGHREVTSIDSSTPPAVVDGFKQTDVTFHYVMKEVPVWAKTSDILAAFPEMALATSGNASGKAKLAQTAVGWQVPD